MIPRERPGAGLRFPNRPSARGWGSDGVIQLAFGAQDGRDLHSAD